jgi:hypothetical protein
MRVVAQTHLVRRGNTFHFRIAVPRELVARVGRSEIKTTLRTTDPLTARQRSRVLSSAIEALFEEVRRMPELTRQHVERRVREYFQDCLDRSHELAATLPKDKRSWDRNAEVSYLNKRIRDLTDTLADRDFTPALEREVLDILHPDNPDAEKGDLPPQLLDLQLFRLHLPKAGKRLRRIGGQIPRPFAQQILVNTKIARRLRHAHTTVLDQAHGLDLELSSKLSSSHRPPPAS